VHHLTLPHKRGRPDLQRVSLFYVTLKMGLEMIVGYARFFTDGQTLDAQQAALLAAGAEKVFAEKVSGAVTERKALARAIAALGHGTCC
jgi:Resolvase, N terminal domain